MSTIELLIKSPESARARTLRLLDGIEKESDLQAISAWRPGPGRAHIRWQLMHVAIIVLVGVFSATAYSADPAVKAHADPQSIGLTPFRQPSDFFPILPWDALHDWKKPYRNLKHGLESIADCGFTMAGFVKPEDLPLCEKLGLAAIMAPAETEQPWFGEWQKLPDQEIGKRVKELVEKAGHSKAVLGYFIMDEPGAARISGPRQGGCRRQKVCPRQAGLHQPFPQLCHGGSADKSQLGTASYTEYLERFVNEVRPQLLSYDNYMVQGSDDLKGQNAGRPTTAICWKSAGWAGSTACRSGTLSRATRFSRNTRCPRPPALPFRRTRLWRQAVGA